MPAFDWKLDDQQIADLATYLRNAWGNRADPVAASAVADTRHTVVAARIK
jgi:mono/diheme cytochrome c family protein